MTSCNAPAAGWASTIPLLCAVAFAAGSIALNVGYGVGRSPDLIGQFVWGAAAAAASLGFTMAMPAFLRACAARQVAPTCLCAIGLIVFGSWSVVSALGSAGGGRASATATERAFLETRERAQGGFDDAKAALAKLGPSRPLAEIAAIVDGTKPRCRDNVCTKPAALLAELGRAQERQRLTDAMDKASATLSVAPARPANSDATTLAAVLAVLGWDVSPERVNGWLILFSVVLLECGAGLSLAIREGLSLAVAAAPTDAPNTERTPASAPCTPPADAPNGTVRRVSARVSAARPITVRPSSVAEWLAARGGRAQTSMRRLAREIGRSPSGVHDEIGRLVASGAITVASGPRGSVLAARAN